MIILSKEQVIKLYDDLIDETGGSFGVREENLLESALAVPFQNFENQELYPSIQQKAARLGYGLIKNHAFIDGNKRIGTHVMLVFLELNKIKISYSQQEFLDVVIKIANGGYTFEDLVHWILKCETSN